MLYQQQSLYVVIAVVKLNCGCVAAVKLIIALFSRKLL